MAKEKTPADAAVALQTDLEKAADDILGGEPIAAVPTETPPSETPPEETPPGETPPGETPPSETPPEETPPVETPPEETPPAETPPVETPPADDLYKTPEGVSKRAGERFEKLVTALKDKDTVIAEKDTVIAKQADEVKLYNQVLESTGLSGDEAVRMIEMGSLIKHNPTQAVKVLQGVVTKMAKDLGMALPGVDLLDGHADLQQRVKDREITQADAEELAKARVTAQRTAQQQQQEEQRRQQEQQRTQRQDQAIAQVDTAKTKIAQFLESKKVDPDFQKMVPFLAEAASFANENLAPEKWLSYIQDEYKRIKTISTSARGTVRNEPIVETHRTQGGAKAPTTLEELADQLL